MDSTADVDYWTSREPREIVRSHLNYIVPDAQKWEQSAAYYVDSHSATDAFVKNAGLGFAIPYFENGEAHEYVLEIMAAERLRQRYGLKDNDNIYLRTSLSGVAFQRRFQHSSRGSR